MDSFERHSAPQKQFHMATIGFDLLWRNHPGRDSKPCNFANQCAVRMGVALGGAGVDLSSFKGARCWHKHIPKHILRAQELANWIAKNQSTFGSVAKYEGVTSANFFLMQGLVFFKDGWGPTDHIDLWNGFSLKAGHDDYFSLAKEVWFWELSTYVPNARIIV